LGEICLENGTTSENRRRDRERPFGASLRGSGRRALYSVVDVPGKTRRAWVRDSWAGFFAGVYIGGIMPFIMVIARKQLHMSEGLIGLMSAAPFIGNLFALLWANSVQGKPKMPYVVWPCIIGRGLFIAMLFVVTPFWYAAIVTVSQFLVTICGPPYAAIMKDIYPDSSRGRMMGYVRVVIALGNVLTALAVGHLLGGWNYRFVFPIAAAFGILSTMFFRTIKTSPPSDEEIADKKRIHEFMIDSVKLLGEDRRFFWFSLSVFIYGFGNLLLLPVFPIFQVDRLHYGTGDVAWLTLVFNVVWMFSYLFWGRYVDEVHPLRAILINVLLSMLIPLNYVLVGLLHNPSIYLLFPSAVFSGVNAAGIELAYFNSVMRFAEPRRVATYMALFTWLGGIRGSIAPFLGAAAMRVFNTHGWDLSYLFVTSMVIMFIGLLTQVVGMREEDRRTRAQAQC
jgi:DHA1 family inner membrane transport protein